MGFGFAKGFVIALILAAGLSIWTKNILNGIVILGIFIVVKVIWNLLTK